MITFISAVFVFGLLIIIHELGHFTVAKLANIKVYELSMGIGTKLIGFKKGETAYNLRLLPIGGFCRMAGMDPDEDAAEGTSMDSENHLPDDRGFNDKPVWVRMAVIVAGPLMNFILAVILFAIIIMMTGMPSESNAIGKVVEGKPAAEAGLIQGDQIVAINGKPVNKWTEVVEQIRANPKEPMNITYVRDKQKTSVIIKPEWDPQEKVGRIGIEPSLQKIGLFQGFKMGLEYTYLVSAKILEFMGGLFTQKASVNDVGGPIRVVAEIGKQAKLGFVNLLNVAAFLSVNLGLFNLFPIPALDGSRLMFLGFEGLRGKPVDPAKENFIHLVGFGLLLLLMVVITYHDISQLMS